MTKYIVTGGKQRTPGYDTVEWSGYATAVSLIFDDETMQASPFVDYISPAENMPDDEDASITFKSASISGRDLLACTTTEIVKISLDKAEVENVISLPVFNDLHHVFKNSKGNYIVTSTGIDAVFEVDEAGNVINEWSTTEFGIWEKFDKNTDYRKVLTTKPHITHPNHCFEYKNEYWVTRLLNRDIMNLQTKEIFTFPFERLHDGHLVGDNAYFTHINGVISRLNIPAREVEEILDLNAIYEGKKSLGWCRGLCLSGDQEIILGFSRLRSTKYDDAKHWIKRMVTNKASYYGCKPTRIAKYDFKNKKLLWEFDLEPHDINAVFSILPIPD